MLFHSFLRDDWIGDKHDVDIVWDDDAQERWQRSVAGALPTSESAVTVEMRAHFEAEDDEEEGTDGAEVGGDTLV